MNDPSFSSSARPTFTPRLTSERSIFVFDLDNTLYPSSSALFPQVERRIAEFVKRVTALPDNQAAAYQKKLFIDHGTTLNGLMIHHNINPDDFLDYVHDIDFSMVEKDIKLRLCLEKLEGRRLIYTNADLPYAEKVLSRLGVTDLFEDIFDIQAGNLLPKPEGEAFDKFLRDHAVDPQQAIMFEDMARNLVPAHQRGLGTVWINNNDTWGKSGHQPGTIDAEINDLSDWLDAYITFRTRISDS